MLSSLLGFRRNEIPDDWEVGDGQGGTAGGTFYFGVNGAVADRADAVSENYDWATKSITANLLVVGTNPPTITLIRNGTEETTVSNGSAITIYPSDTLIWRYTAPTKISGIGSIYFPTRLDLGIRVYQYA